MVRAAKQLHFNHDGEALKRMQVGVEKLARVVGVTLGPKGRNVVLENKYGSPRIVNDGVTVAREVDLEDSVEDAGAKLVRQASSKTNDVAGDGTTTATILSSALIAEGVRVVGAGTNPVPVARGLAWATKRLVEELERRAAPVRDADLVDVATVSAGGNREVGQLISDALARVGRRGVVTLEESKTADDSLEVVEGMQFDRGYLSPYFVTDPERMVAEYEDARILLVDRKVSAARDLVKVLEAAIRNAFPLVIVAEDVEQEALATLVVNKLRGHLRVVAAKAPGFGERRSAYLEDIAALTGATVVSDAVGIPADGAAEEHLGRVARATLTKDAITLVGPKDADKAVADRVKAIRAALERTDSDYEKEKLNERIARLSGGVALVRVGANTETELKEKKLRVEDALNATKAAVEEGIVAGGGATLAHLVTFAKKLRDELPADADPDEKLGVDVLARALTAPLKLIAENAGDNGAVVSRAVLDSEDPKFGYNAATGEYQDLVAAGIIDPAKVVRSALENASSVARTFLTSSVVVTEIPSQEPAAQGMPGGGDFGY